MTVDRKEAGVQAASVPASMSGDKGQVGLGRSTIFRIQVSPSAKNLQDVVECIATYVVGRQPQPIFYAIAVSPPEWPGFLDRGRIPACRPQAAGQRRW